MQTHKFIGIGLMGLFLVGVVFPAHIVSASSHWIQESVADFNSDTMTNLEIHQLCPADTVSAFVHLVDNQSETKTSNFVTNSYQAIISGTAYACAFHPSFNAMCDEVDLQIYVQGNPVDVNGAAALITISLYTAAGGAGIHQPIAQINSPQGYAVTQTYETTNYLPSQSGSWFPLYFTETDSYHNAVEASLTNGQNNYYSVKITSNAVQDVNNEIRWEYKTNSDSASITTDVNNGGGWAIFVGNGNSATDPNIKIQWHDFVHTGNLISTVYNTGKPSTFTWFDALERDSLSSTIIYYVRTGNSPTPDQTWSAWTLQSRGQWNNGCPNGHYVQYKFILTACNDPGGLQYDAYTSAVVTVDITYI